MTPDGGPISGAGRVAVWQRFGRALWRLKFLLTLLVIAGFGAAFGLSVHAHKRYRARALIQLAESAPAGAAGAPLRQFVATAQTLAGTSAVRSQAASMVGGPSALGTITITGDPVGGFVTIASTQRSPTAAAAAANAYARATIATVAAPASASLAQPATPPRSPFSPRKVRNTVLGGVAGLLVALLLVLLAAVLDRRLRTVTDVEHGFGLAVLTSVPAEAFKGKRSPATEAAFARLRASLVNLENERPIRTVMVVSAAVNEGKTLVSTNLAIALARAGKDVILLEADLRRPRVAARLGLATPAPYAATITDPESIERALTKVSLPEPAFGRLRALACDAPAASPAELLESGEMMRALERMSELADVVVIDSSPLLAVPDALSLLPLVDAVVLVARLRRTRSDLLREALGQLRQAKATLAGAVVTGARRGDPYYAGGYLPSKPVAPAPGAPGITARRPRTADQPPPPVEFAPPPASPPSLEPEPALEPEPEAALAPEPDPEPAPAPEPEPAPAPEPEPEPAPEPHSDPVHEFDPAAEFLVALAPAYAPVAPDNDDAESGSEPATAPPPPPPLAQRSPPPTAWAPPPPPPPPGSTAHPGSESAFARWRRRRAARRPRP